MSDWDFRGKSGLMLGGVSLRALDCGRFRLWGDPDGEVEEPEGPPSWILTVGGTTTAGMNGNSTGSGTGTYGSIAPGVTPDGTIVFGVFAQGPSPQFRMRAGAAGDEQFNGSAGFTVNLQGWGDIPLTWNGSIYTSAMGGLKNYLGANIGNTLTLTGIPTA